MGLNAKRSIQRLANNSPQSCVCMNDGARIPGNGEMLLTGPRVKQQYIACLGRSRCRSQ